MAFQNIFVLGASGQVGSELVRQVSLYDGPEHEHRNPTRIVGIANSVRYILSAWGVVIPENIDPIKMKEFMWSDKLKKYNWHEEILESIRRIWMEWEVIFIDVTADIEAMKDTHFNVIEHTTNRIVTANKKPAASDMSVFTKLTGDPHRYRYNTTVMAGAWAVPYFQEVHGLGEKIQSVEGTFSGTLAYVCSELERWEKSFSQIVKEAKALGYTEPHPIDDLNGEDVKRKLLILLRSAGIHIEDSDIILEWLVDPKKYENMDTESFLVALEWEDADIWERVQTAKKDGRVPRYVASYKEQDGIMKAHVWLQFVFVGSELWMLQWTANKLLVHTNQRTPTWSAPHVIQSPWAWVWKTAASVRADLLYLLNGTNLWAHN